MVETGRLKIIETVRTECSSIRIWFDGLEVYRIEEEVGRNI